MSKISLFALILICAQLFVLSCSEPPAPPIDETPKAVLKSLTSGRIELNEIPKEGITIQEIVVVSELDAKTREQLKLQRALFESKITGIPFVNDEPPPLGVSPGDAVKLQAQLSGLKQKYPEVLNLERNVGNQRFEPFRSNTELYFEFQDLFKAISLENIDRAVKVLDERIQTKGKEVVAGVDRLNTNSSIQGDVDLEWLRALHELLKEYNALANDLKKAAYDYQIATEAAAPLYETWEDFMAVEATLLLSDVFSHSLGASELAEDGSFEVEGQGILVLRVEYGLYSAYFLVEDPNENRATLSDVKQFEAKRL